MIKAVMIDDEAGARQALKALLNNYCPEVEICAECSSVPDGVLAINKNSPDVVFLDIEMPEYNGFELLDFFKKIDFEVVFVTAYSQYAIKAFEVSAVDYLLKPVNAENLKSAVEKVSQRKAQSSMMERLELMKSSYRNEELRKIALPMSDGLLFVEINDVVLFEADRVYTTVFLSNGSKVTVSKPMRTFEDILTDRVNFYRPHRSFLVNLNFIKKYNRGESVMILDNGINVTISRDKKQEFESLLKELRLLS